MRISDLISRKEVAQFKTKVTNLLSLKPVNLVSTTLIPSSALAAATAIGVYLLTEIPEKYPYFTAGNLAWGNGTKTQDYYAIFAFIFSFPLFTILLNHFQSVVFSRQPRNTAAPVIYRRSISGFLPLLVLWLVFVATSGSRGLLLPGLYLFALLTFLFYTLARVVASKLDLEYQVVLPVKLLMRLIVNPLLMWFSVLGAYVFLHRGLGLGWPLQIFEYLSFAIATSVWVVQLICTFRVRNLSRLVQISRLMTSLSSLGLPLLFWALVPGNVLAGDQIIELVRPTVALTIVILLFSISAWVGLLSERFQSKSGHLKKFLKFLPYLALISFVKIEPSTIMTLPSDDYHYGEFTVPWFSLKADGLLPYADLEPARGLNNYLSGFFSDVFFNGTVSAYSFSNQVAYIFLAAAFTFAAIRWLPSAVIFTLLLVFPGVNGLSEIDLIVSAFVLLSATALGLKNFFIGISSLSVLSCFIIVFAPGQGALAVLSVLAALLFFKKWTVKTRLLGALLFASIQMACLAIPILGQIYFGALRYGFEQIGMNSVANGIEWKSSVGASGGNIWFFELVRGSWIVVPAMFLAILLTSKQIISKSQMSKFFSIALTLLTIAFVVRAAGRIDPGFSRMGFAAIWFFAILVPVFYFTALRGRYALKPIAALFAFLGLLIPSISSGILDQPPLARIRAALSTQVVSQPSYENSSATQRDFPIIGRAVIDEAQKANLAGMDSVIQKIAGASGTYLDLTNHAAIYAYLKRVPPIQVPAVYNLISLGQQERAIKALEANMPALFLVSNSNIVHDGGNVWGLRSPLFFRWILGQQANYTFMSENGRVWLVENSKITFALENTQLRTIPREMLPFKLGSVWNVSDLLGLPSSYGGSIQTLAHQLNGVNKFSKIQTVNSIELQGDSLSLAGEDPYIRFPLTGMERVPGELYFLKFEYTCESNCSYQQNAAIYWSGPNQPESELRSLRFKLNNGALIVPLFASSYWVFEPGSVQTLRLDFENFDKKSVLTVKNFEILKLRDK